MSRIENCTCKFNHDLEIEISNDKVFAFVISAKNQPKLLVMTNVVNGWKKKRKCAFNFNGFVFEHFKMSLFFFLVK